MFKNTPKFFKKLINYFSYGIFLIFLSIIFFVRSFVGVYIGEFRIGEYLFLIALILSFFFLIFNFKNNYTTKYLRSIYVFLIISFFAVCLISESNFFTTYTYKSSSYIWSISFLFLGYYLFNFKDFDYLYLNIFRASLLVIYIFLVIKTPVFIVNFFKVYSDKIEFHKGSDILLFFVIIMVLNNKRISKDNFSIYYFLILSSLFFPLLLFKSRAAAIAGILFFVIEIYRYKEIVFRNFRVAIINLLLLTIVSNVSLFFVSNSQELINYDTRSFYDLIEYRNSSYNQDNTDHPIFWMSEGRIYSADGNLNWRLQIWQDVIVDTSKEFKTVIFGYGYKEIIPAMSLPSRQGLDGLNENVHNFIVNIYARGGILQITLFSLFYFSIFSFYNKNFQNLEILIYAIPILFVAFFDGAMENAHFSLMYYFFLGRLLSVGYVEK